MGGGGFGGGGFAGGGGFSDIFEDIFGEMMGGGRGGRARSTGGRERGADLRYNMEISLEEAFTGKTAQIRVPTSITCDVCTGSGAKPGTQPKTCTTCQGSGRVRAAQGFFSIERTCPTCMGRGQMIDKPCRACSGEGRVKRERTLNVSIPAGVEDGTMMRLKDKGQPGTGGHGDGIVMVEVGSHPFFRREGDNIRMDLPITLDEAVRGAKVKCPTVDGAVMLTIKPGSSGGTVLRLAGKGWTRKTGKTTDGKPERGDQLVTIEIQLPADMAALEERLEGWIDTARPRDKFGL